MKGKSAKSANLKSKTSNALEPLEKEWKKMDNMERAKFVMYTILAINGILMFFDLGSMLRHSARKQKAQAQIARMDAKRLKKQNEYKEKWFEIWM